MRPVFAALALLLTLPAVLAADLSEKLVGKLEPELVPDDVRFTPFSLDPAPEGMGAELPAPPSPGDHLFVGKIPWTSRTERQARMVLVEPAQGKPWIYADVDLDGKLSAAERFELADDPDLGGLTTILRFSWSLNPYRSFPARLILAAEMEGLSPSQGQRVLIVSDHAHFQGTVDIDGRKTLVRWGINSEHLQLDPTQGHVGIDVDGDGSINGFFGSPEVDRPQGSPAIFRVGDRYVSLEAIDPAAGRIVLRTHPASDYKRFDLSKGAQVPDFTFQDFAGKSRRLSEFRGKYVLLEFWATWCAPCVAEFPHLKKAYETYRSRGFEILGLNRDESAEAARVMIEKHQISWTQATSESIESVAVQGFRVQGLPATLLLDPEGRVVSTGAPKEARLRREKLLETLEGLLPKAEPAH